MTGPEIGRGEHNVGPRFRWKRAEPPSEGDRLPLALRRERNIHVADIDVDHVMARLHRGIASDIARGLPVTDDIEQIGPDLIRVHAWKQVKERTKRELAFAS